jgi:hypothetical protein
VLRRTSKLVLEIVATLVAGIAVIVALLAWRLDAGPISLAFLKPYIEAALSAPDGAYRVRIDRAVLAWRGWEQTLALRAKGSEAVAASGQVLARVPELDIHLSTAALLHGVIAPVSLDFVGAQLRLHRDAQGNFVFQLGEEAGGQGGPSPLPGLMQQLLSKSDPSRPLSYLRSVTVIGADLVVDDSHWDRSWKTQLNRLSLARNLAGIRARADLDLLVGEDRTHFEFNGLYRAAADDYSLKIDFNRLRPAVFAGAAPELAQLSRLGLPIDGKINLDFKPGYVFDQLRFDLVGEGGSIAIPELYPAPLAVNQVALRGALAEGGSRLDLDEAFVDLGGGTTVSLSGAAHGLGGDSSFGLAVTARDVKVDELPQRWPASLAPNPRKWIVENLSGGKVDEAQATIIGHAKGLDPDSLALDSVSGTMRMSDVDVHYLGKMPKVLGVSGSARFDEKRFNIAVTKGAASGLSVDEGTIAITGLDVKDQDIDIQLVLRGPLRSALEVIDSPPLGYASSLGIAPKSVGGDTAVRLAIKFPLVKDLRFAQMQVAAAANMKDVAIASIALGQDLSNGDLALRINKDGMNVAGKARLGPMPIALDWNESFGKAGGRRIHVTGDLDPAAREAFGLDAGDILSGTLPMTLDMTSTGKQSARIDVALDLAPAEIAFPRELWHKAPGVPGKARLDLRLAGEKLVAIDSFSAQAADLALQGRASFDPASGALASIAFDRLDFGSDRLAGELQRRAERDYAVTLTGASLDASPFLKRKSKPAPQAPPEKGPRLAVSLNIAKLWLDTTHKGYLGSAKGSFDYDGERLARAKIDATTESGAPLRVAIDPGAHGRTLLVESDDAGSVLRTLDIVDDVAGGKLRVSGIFDDSKPESPLSGSLGMNNFKLLNAPFAARLLTLASLTGISDELNGKGVSFSYLTAGYVRSDGKLALSDGRAVGSDLGVTFEGKIDFDADTIAVNGTIVPIYTLNSLLGNIPLLGPLLVGPKGGGVFAATYQATGKLDNPDFSVNPLAALAPGILRGFVDLLSGGSGSAPPPPPTDEELGGVKR